jgi:menaquinone-9 beta-reductase
MRRTPALIVGGGPAGSAAAITLARGGTVPRLIERSTGDHDVVCGGFLGWDALAALKRLGIDTAALGARPIHRLRLVSATQALEVALPKPAAGLSRRTLDAALLAAAARAGANLERGRSARFADPESKLVRLGDGEEIAADALFLATGKHELRGARREVKTRVKHTNVGLRTALSAPPTLQAELGGVIELHLFDGGYAGLLLQEDGAANLCLSLKQSRLMDAGGIDSILGQIAEEAPCLGERLGAGISQRWITVSGVPYGWSTRMTVPGVFRIGDQGAVIASLAGDGIAIALGSGISAATALLRMGPEGAKAYQREYGRRSTFPLALAEALKWGAERKLPRSVLMHLLQRQPGLARLAARLTRVA